MAHALFVAESVGAHVHSVTAAKGRTDIYTICMLRKAVCAAREAVHPDTSRQSVDVHADL